MKKILHMTPPDINNGVHRYLFNHMQYLDHEKFQFAFLNRNAEKLMKTPEYQKYHFEIQSFHNTERDSRDGLRREIIRILSKGYDVIHLHTSIWRGFLIEEIAMEMGIPKVIVHAHSTGIDDEGKDDREKLLQIHEKYKDMFDLELATDVCACSVLAGEWLYGPKIPREQIKIMPNAIDIKEYHFQCETRKRMRNQLNIDDRTVIGNVGRYSYQKNQEFLVRSFAKAYRNNPKLYLLLIGQGDLIEKIRKLIYSLGIEDAVLCLDWQEHVEHYLQAMDVFCLPSYFEGMPISVIEAQTAGLPCFVSDKVTEEVKITELVTFLPLIEEMWQFVMEHSRSNDHRERFDEQIAKSGFDIKREVLKLESLYQ